jgi:nucleotide-binding universal stress UspA family protein
MLPDKKQTAAKSGTVIGSLTALGLPSEPSQGLGTDLLGRFHDRASQKARVVLRTGERDQDTEVQRAADARSVIATSRGSRRLTRVLLGSIAHAYA